MKSVELASRLEIQERIDVAALSPKSAGQAGFLCCHFEGKCTSFTSYTVQHTLGTSKHVECGKEGRNTHLGGSHREVRGAQFPGQAAWVESEFCHFLAV